MHLPLTSTIQKYRDKKTFLLSRRAEISLYLYYLTTMSRKTRYIAALTPSEKQSLEQGYKTAKSHLTRRKCHAILLSSEGKSIPELCNLFAVTNISVYTWFNSWESSGIKGLELKPGRGRKAKLNKNDPAQVKKIKTLVENNPKSLRQVVSQLQTDLGITVSTITLSRFLKKTYIIAGNASASP